MTRLLQVPRGHLVHAIALEHQVLLDVADALVALAARAIRTPDPWTIVPDVREIAARLGTAESLYDREERVIFSRLELRGIIGLPHALRLDHHAIRLEAKALRDLAAGPGDARTFRRELRRIRNTLVPLLRDHVRRELLHALPLALEVIGEETWTQMRLECDALERRACWERKELSA